MARKISELKDDPQAYPLSWQRMSNPKGFLAAEWDSVDLKKYLRALEQEQKLWEEIRKNRESTREQIVEAISQVAMFRGERRMYLDQDTGRTSYPPSVFVRQISSGALNAYLASKKAIEGKEKPSDIETIKAFLKNTGKSLEGVYYMMFGRENSKGWRSEQERTDLLQALDNLISDTEKSEYQKQCGEVDFADEWESRVQAVKEWKNKFAEKLFDDSVDHGKTEEEVLALLKDWEIEGSMEEWKKIAEGDMRKLKRILKGLLKKEKVESLENFSSDQDILTEAKKVAGMFKVEMIDGGILPIPKGSEWGEVTFNMMTKSGSNFVASCTTEGIMNVLAYQGSEEFWQENRARFQSIIWHELMHRYQYLFTESKEIFPHECGAVAAEAVMLEKYKENVEIITDGIKSSVLRALQFVVSMDVAKSGMDNKRRRNFRKRFQALGCTNDQIERFERMLPSGIPLLGQYYIAEKLFAVLVENSGSAKNAMKQWIKRLGLGLPPHLAVVDPNP